MASTTLTDPVWSGPTVLADEFAIAIRELNAKPGEKLQVHGSLINEMTLIVVPVILGQGAGLFPETGTDLALKLIESRVNSKGVAIQVFRPAGRPEYATM